MMANVHHALVANSVTSWVEPDRLPDDPPIRDFMHREPVSSSAFVALNADEV